MFLISDLNWIDVAVFFFGGEYERFHVFFCSGIDIKKISIF